jgi:acyl-coenzyme A thioesterase PaaI-like protein
VAGKKTTAKPEKVERGSAHVRLDLTEEHRDKLRVVAAKAGMSMANYARAVVVERILREEPT